VQQETGGALTADNLRLELCFAIRCILQAPPKPSRFLSVLSLAGKEDMDLVSDNASCPLRAEGMSVTSSDRRVEGSKEERADHRIILTR
jgi:hypothetical protein